MLLTPILFFPRFGNLMLSSFWALTSRPSITHSEMKFRISKLKLKIRQAELWAGEEEKSGKYFLWGSGMRENMKLLLLCPCGPAS